ncbi:LysR family transcriptional regulator [Roseibium sp. TrichSKD4]|uniref:hypothetical protein n=1 Tax=Roseibium sp. TrichSKD4 TaxID=744980 RepID=UPI0001E565F0|nr:hypothetical protein [Roseibium sp. TrichSKD4]EFO34031.1 LysR family transcriptional regulator [Roseibium sp. TrichSKD4]
MIQTKTQNQVQTVAKYEIVDAALSDLNRVRADLLTPHQNVTEAIYGQLIEKEEVSLAAVARSEALTLEAVMEKCALLSSELARTSNRRSVRMLATSIACDVEQILSK